MNWLIHTYEKLARVAVRIDSRECLLIVATLLVVGFVCMRGFGSRTNW